jgi:hypothetical protein
MKKLLDNPIVLFFAVLGALVAAIDCFHAHLYFPGIIMSILGLTYLITAIENIGKYIKAH